VACFVEILLGRVASILGVYGAIGVDSPLIVLAQTGRVAMTSIGLTGIALTSALLLRLTLDDRFASRSTRFVLVFLSPLYLPLVMVAVFRPIAPAMTVIGYLVATFCALIVVGVVLRHRISGGAKRIALALGLVQLLTACEFLLGGIEGSWAIIPRRAYLYAEVLYAVTPLFALLMLYPGGGSFLSFIKRVPALAVLGALAIAGVGVWIGTEPSIFSLLAFRGFGVTLSLPGQPYIYEVGVFCGSLLIGSLIFPGRRWRPTNASRRLGIGLALIWFAGLQPTDPYLFLSMLLGFLYLARGLLDENLEGPIPMIAAGD